jgi:hypothetical protein
MLSCFLLQLAEVEHRLGQGGLPPVGLIFVWFDRHEGQADRLEQEAEIRR